MTQTRGKTKLNGISDIRRYFHRNPDPIYFISATNFNLLGLDEWVIWPGKRVEQSLQAFRTGQHRQRFDADTDATEVGPVH